MIYFKHHSCHMMLSHFTKWKPSKFMPNISWMFRAWSTCNNTSTPILQPLKTVYQRFANTIPNNSTIVKIRLSYWPVYVYEVLQTNKRPNPLKNSNATPTFRLTLCKWFLQVRNWSIVRRRHFVLSTCCNVKPFMLCMAVYAYVGLCKAMYGCVGLCRSM